MNTSTGIPTSRFHPPVQLTRRQALWGAGLLVFLDFVVLRVILPAMLSAKSDLAFWGGVIGLFALVLAHIDVIWSFVDPAVPAGLTACAFCGDQQRMNKLTTFAAGDTVWYGCSKDPCKVGLARRVKESLLGIGQPT